MTIVYCLLSVAASRQWIIHQMDIHNAFLHGDLDEKALLQIDHYKSVLSRHFKTKDLGPLKYFLSLEVARSFTGIFINQRKYTLDILSNSGQLGARPASFPMEQNLKLTASDGNLLSDPSPYRQLVGRLIYLTITRPDIAFAVNILSQFMHTPRAPHLTAAHQVLRYFKCTSGHGIFFAASSGLQLIAYTDSDWASCSTTRRSTTATSSNSGPIPFLGAPRNRQQ
ncbi:uncharacterized protein LOC111395312 [Olea europaea var. sylvestris]|uniref:uncharacterized protein LOC111395312 n=1 Tax=Olea europaea var. sylvestris TaxID=158386 RepID=UPI000C1CE71E|nr:uncharacterized protein LOC111395312 [Olea europaea var. sylvestris]